MLLGVILCSQYKLRFLNTAVYLTTAKATSKFIACVLVNTNYSPKCEADTKVADDWQALEVQANSSRTALAAQQCNYKLNLHKHRKDFLSFTSTASMD